MMNGFWAVWIINSTTFVEIKLDI